MLHESNNPFKLTVIYDNNSYDEELTPDWGFSCLIEGFEKTILFDTGANGKILLKNMQKLDINPHNIDIVVLSHFHYDHTGGLEEFLKVHSKVTIYMPSQFPENFKQKVQDSGAKIINVTNSVEICSSIYSTGVLEDNIPEQSLFLKTNKGNIITTGCSHPGIVSIIKKVKKLSKEPILFVMGGFHLLDKTKKSLDTIIDACSDLSVKYVAPCHCSEKQAQDIFKKNFKEKYISVGVGKVITQTTFG